MRDIKENFFASDDLTMEEVLKLKPVKEKKPEPVTVDTIRLLNDDAFRRDFGMWLYERFNNLTAEYKKHGRFLTLQEIQ